MNSSNPKVKFFLSSEKVIGMSKFIKQAVKQRYNMNLKDETISARYSMLLNNIVLEKPDFFNSNSVEKIESYLKQSLMNDIETLVNNAKSNNPSTNSQIVGTTPSGLSYISTSKSNNETTKKYNEMMERINNEKKNDPLEERRKISMNMMPAPIQTKTTVSKPVGPVDASSNSDTLSGAFATSSSLDNNINSAFQTISGSPASPLLNMSPAQRLQMLEQQKTSFSMPTPSNTNELPDFLKSKATREEAKVPKLTQIESQQPQVIDVPVQKSLPLPSTTTYTTSVEQLGGTVTKKTTVSEKINQLQETIINMYRDEIIPTISESVAQNIKTNENIANQIVRKAVESVDSVKKKVEIDSEKTDNILRNVETSLETLRKLSLDLQKNNSYINRENELIEFKHNLDVKEQQLSSELKSFQMVLDERNHAIEQKIELFNQLKARTDVSVTSKIYSTIINIPETGNLLLEFPDNSLEGVHAIEITSLINITPTKPANKITYRTFKININEIPLLMLTNNISNSIDSVIQSIPKPENYSSLNIQFSVLDEDSKTFQYISDELRNTNYKMMLRVYFKSFKAKSKKK